jgi:hypothetical protein
MRVQLELDRDVVQGVQMHGHSPFTQWYYFLINCVQGKVVYAWQLANNINCVLVLCR